MVALGFDKVCVYCDLVVTCHRCPWKKTMETSIWCYYFFFHAGATASQQTLLSSKGLSRGAAHTLPPRRTCSTIASAENTSASNLSVPWENVFPINLQWVLHLAHPPKLCGNVSTRTDNMSSARTVLFVFFLNTHLTPEETILKGTTDVNF